MVAIVPTLYIPHDAPVALSSTDTRKTTDGSLPPCNSASSDMNRHVNHNMNPDAHPFRPNDAAEAEEHRTQDRTPWSTNCAPPPLPPVNNAPQAHSGHSTLPHVHPYHQQWLQYYHSLQAYNTGLQGGFQHTTQPYGAPYNQPYYGAPPLSGQQGQVAFVNQANHYSTQSSAPAQFFGPNVDAQYAFNALYKDLRSSSNRYRYRAPRPSVAKTHSETTSHGQGKQNEYDSYHKPAVRDAVSSRVDKRYRTTQSPKVQPSSRKQGRYGDTKIMLPAPEPTQDYLSQAAAEPSFVSSSNHILVILDLNGTVLYRPNKNAKTMIERPYLRPFLRYLFENFSVMVWSSAKPENVKSLVMQALDNKLQSQLVARWARDSFGLSPANYSQNVQVYKNLRLVWSRDVIQQRHPEYTEGKRFSQHNTVLIDDSAIKANAQPFNLLEIPEFSATQEQMEGDVLRSVAGYLEILRQQADVSQFIMKQPFKDDGQWNFLWPEGTVSGGGEMKTQITTEGKKQKKKKKKKKGNTSSMNTTPVSPSHEHEDTAAVHGEGSVITVSSPLEKVQDFNSNSLEASALKDW